jgi:hypothetical protein
VGVVRGGGWSVRRRLQRHGTARREQHRQQVGAQYQAHQLRLSIVPVAVRRLQHGEARVLAPHQRGEHVAYTLHPVEAHLCGGCHVVRGKHILLKGSMDAGWLGVGVARFTAL